VLSRTLDKARPQHGKLKLTLALATGAALIALQGAPAQAGDGGTNTSGSDATTTDNATLRDGKAIPPSDAPSRVVGVIDAANRIAKGKDYCYGGGHSSFKSSCYDCSGSVSYALHGGRFIDQPMDSRKFMHWARHGKGKWITVFANRGHAFMVVAGLRFDTSMTPGAGPGWSEDIHAENWRDFRKRHKGRF
jgi:cell wall-associated NlpC family hydrolase